MSLAAELAAALAAPRLALLHAVAALAAERGLALWLVGGPVRDLLLGRAISDLDLVVEGDAPALAATVAEKYGGRLTIHTAFATATVLVDDLSLDFVSARRESYPRPAMLPVVAPGTLADDQARRDFTINTLALSLAPATWGDVVDALGGVADMERAVVRVLHAQSFVDDPTRILRAARFAGRLNYTIEPWTLGLMREAVPFIRDTSPARLLNELYLLVREPSPAAALRWLPLVGALPALDVTWDDVWGEAAFAEWAQLPLGSHKLVVALGLLAPGAADWSVRYPVTAAEARMFRHTAALATQAPSIVTAPDDAALDALLQPGDAAALWVTALGPHGQDDPALAGAITHYLHQLRPISTLVDGDDLRRLGLAPGPRFRTLLAAARAAQLRGAFADHAEALVWLRSASDAP